MTQSVRFSNNSVEPLTGVGKRVKFIDKESIGSIKYKRDYSPKEERKVYRSDIEKEIRAEVVARGLLNLPLGSSSKIMPF